MQEILNHQLGRAMIVLPLVIIGNILFGAAEAGIQGYWDRNKFITGLTKGLLIYLGVGLFAYVSIIAVDLQVEFSGETYTLVDAMHLIIWGAVLAYATDAIKKLSNLFKLKVGE